MYSNIVIYQYNKVILSINYLLYFSSFIYIIINILIEINWSLLDMK